jgi:hypothetical protein
VQKTLKAVVFTELVLNQVLGLLPAKPALTLAAEIWDIVKGPVGDQLINLLPGIRLGPSQTLPISFPYAEIKIVGCSIPACESIVTIDPTTGVATAQNVSANVTWQANIKEQFQQGFESRYHFLVKFQRNIAVIHGGFNQAFVIANCEGASRQDNKFQSVTPGVTSFSGTQPADVGIGCPKAGLDIFADATAGQNTVVKPGLVTFSATSHGQTTGTLPPIDNGSAFASGLAAVGISFTVGSDSSYTLEGQVPASGDRLGSGSCFAFASLFGPSGALLFDEVAQCNGTLAKAGTLNPGVYTMNMELLLEVKNAPGLAGSATANANLRFELTPLQ